MKKILFSAVTLDVGGIETALVTLLNCLVNKYEITLVLEKKQGIFLDELDSRIKIIEYSPSDNKIVLIRKFINLLKQLNVAMQHIQIQRHLLQGLLRRIVCYGAIWIIYHNMVEIRKK